ncbi:AMP-binding protein [Rhodococcus oxybenzonivorans]|uniref:AMP-binding protein n=1 Tax=Rhodococcus oxybenzonivorans TaxID=1990687 RepID=UPI002698D764
MASVRSVDNHLIEDAAARLADAERAGAPCTPVRDLIGRTDIDTAYRVQTRNVDAAVAAGHRIVGRKIGLTSPARIWEKLRSALLARFQSAPPEQRAAIDAALEVGLQKVRAEQSGVSIADELAAAYSRADAGVFAPLRAQLGLDEVVLLMTGAAPIPPAVHEFFLAIGLPLAEGFGMSETGALGMTNLPGDIRLGSVGKAMPGTEARTADDGELLLRGAHVMRGYRKDPVKLPRPSTKTAGCTPATSPRSTTRVSSASSTARRS